MGSEHMQSIYCRTAANKTGRSPALWASRITLRLFILSGILALLGGCGSCPSAKDADSGKGSFILPSIQFNVDCPVPAQGGPADDPADPSDADPDVNDPPPTDDPSTGTPPADPPPADPPPVDTPPVDPDPATPPNANASLKDTFVGMCSSCHGETGAGVEDMGPSLNLDVCMNCGDVATLAKYIHDNMPAGDPSLCIDDCADSMAIFIVLQLQDLMPPPPPPPPPPVAENRDGPTIYQDECASCHGVDGSGLEDMGLSLLPGECGSCGNLLTLYDKIDAEMPQSDPTTCTGDCAARVARFVFDGLSIEPLQYTRREYYENFGCAGCHGENGEGGNGPSLLQGECMTCSDYPVLVNTILNTMPKDRSTELCGGDCAIETAQFIFTAFNEHDRLTGKQLYEFNCQGCHGAAGEGGNGPPLLPEICVNCGDIKTLAEHISVTMPPDGVDWACTIEAPDRCAVLVSEYILTAFTGNALVAQQHYDLKCASCHGADGEGTDMAPAFAQDTCPSCASAGALYMAISDTMPQGNPLLCDRVCALLLTQMIYGWVKPPDPVPASDPTPPPVPADPMPPGNGQPPPVCPGNGNGGAACPPPACLPPGCPTPPPVDPMVPAPVYNTGQEYFDGLCAGCHGAYGEGADNGPPLTTAFCSVCSELPTLYQKVLDEMPQGDPAQCGAECAKKVANFIFNGFTDDYVFNGREYYFTMCAGCHGRLGEGGSAPALMGDDCLLCSDATAMYREILNEMPSGAAGLCDETCAQSVTQYIVDGFKLSAQPNAMRLYAQQCASCHGDAGQGTGDYPALTVDVCGQCADAALVTEYVELSMPQGASELCMGSCAMLMGDYVANVINAPAGSVSYPHPGDAPPCLDLENCPPPPSPCCSVPPPPPPPPSPMCCDVAAPPAPDSAPEQMPELPAEASVSMSLEPPTPSVPVTTPPCLDLEDCVLLEGHYEDEGGVDDNMMGGGVMDGMHPVQWQGDATAPEIVCITYPCELPADAAPL